MQEVLVNRLGGLSLPRKSVVRLTDRPDMTLDVYRGRKTTIQQQLVGAGHLTVSLLIEVQLVVFFCSCVSVMLLTSNGSPGPEVIKLFSCSTQLGMNFFLFIIVKMPTCVGILTFMSGKNSILDLSELKRSRIA